MPKFNGHKNWNHWNVSLWINNDEGLYNEARRCIRRNSRHGRQRAAEDFLAFVGEGSKTPDGAPYSVTTIRAAMVGM